MAERGLHGTRHGLLRGATLALLLLAFALMMANVRAWSPTMDEQNHITRGYALLRTGDPRLSLEHPPLVNALEALPLLLLGDQVTLPLDDPTWAQGAWYQVADLFLWHVNDQPDRMVFLARLPVVALTLTLIALAARWARELWGAPAGLAAAALLTLDPNVLAHGCLATTDLGLTFTAFGAAYAVWRVSRRARPRPRAVLLVGLALGAMLASKTSAPLFWGVLGLLWCADALRGSGRWRRAAQRAGLYLAATAVALVVLWTCYAFDVSPVLPQGPAVPLGTYARGVQAVLTNVQGGRPSYLLGETRLGGWPLYFPITFAVKTPLPTLLLVLWAVPVALRRRRAWPSLFLLLPVALYWAAALASDLNLGYRHLLPTLPFLYVWAAQGVGKWGNRHIGKSAHQHIGKSDHVRRFPLPVSRLIPRLLFLLLALTTLRVAPHVLAYFNVLGGGPTRGWRVVADSNIDWGQDLKRLRAYLATHDLGPIKLSWFGSAYPGAYGIAYEPLPGLPHHFPMWFEPTPFDEQQPEPGVYVISVSNLVELPLEDKHVFTYFRAREPDARIGYSIYIYKVGEP